MMGSSMIKRSIAILAIVVFLIFVFYENIHLFSASSYLCDLCEGERMVTIKRQKVELSDCFSFDDNSENENYGFFQLELKKKIHIKVKNLIFMNIFFSMVLFPMLTFITSIRLFGRCLARLWHVIVYIHKSDGGEIPLCCLAW